MADNFNLRTFLTENKLTKNTQILKEGSDYGFEVLMDAVDDLYAPGTPEHDELASAVEQAMHNGEIDMSEFGDDNSAPSRAVDAIANEIGLGLEEGTEEEVPENLEDYTKQPGYVHETLTAKELRLVEMVQDALGVTRENHQNADPNIPNDSTDMAIGMMKNGIPEGEDTGEMTDETVIPEYNTIDELMNSIDYGTNKVAEEHKISEMKKIANALREKAKKMEESEHAAHISPKDLKQLATDAAKLEKAAEKLKAAFDKKFNKKEKAAPKKEKEAVALQEGFDLRKYLAENREK